MELEFRVPFLSVPVKRAMETMQTMGWASVLGGEIPSANLNVAALVLGGVIILGSAVAVPAITALMSKKQGFIPHDGPTKRKNGDRLVKYPKLECH